MSLSKDQSTTPEDFERGLVLIAEDEEPLADTIAHVVREAGYRPLIALHGREALELTQTRRPALAIVDLMLPHVNGATLIRSLRDHGAAIVPPIIVITAASPVTARAAGGDAVLLKPFKLVDLENLLRRFLGPPTEQADFQISGAPV